MQWTPRIQDEVELQSTRNVLRSVGRCSGPELLPNRRPFRATMSRPRLRSTLEPFEEFVNVVVLSCSYVAVRAVIDYGLGIHLVEQGRVEGEGGLFGNPNDMALNLVAFLPLAIIVTLGRGRPLLRGVLAIGTPALVAAIIFSKSRGGTLGLIAMLAVLL